MADFKNRLGYKVIGNKISLILLKGSLVKFRLLYEQSELGFLMTFLRYLISSTTVSPYSTQSHPSTHFLSFPYYPQTLLRSPINGKMQHILEVILT